MSGLSLQGTGLSITDDDTQGTVTSVSVVSANGFAGSVATDTSTPAITLSTTINAAVLAGNGTAIAAATTTGSGSTVVLATGPTLTTPALGVATATSVNGLTITTTTGVLTITNAKTLAVSNSLTFTGTDSTSFAFPSTSDTVVTLTAAQTLTNKTLTAPVLGAATGTSLAVSATIATGAPAGSSAGLWKLGALQAGAVTPDATQSLYVDVGGVVYKLIIAS